MRLVAYAELLILVRVAFGIEVAIAVRVLIGVAFNIVQLLPFRGDLDELLGIHVHIGFWKCIKEHERKYDEVSVDLVTAMWAHAPV